MSRLSIRVPQDIPSIAIGGIFILLALTSGTLQAEPLATGLHPVVRSVAETTEIEYHNGDQLVARHHPGSPCGITLRSPDLPNLPLALSQSTGEKGLWKFSPITAGPLTLTVSFKQITPSLLERRIDVQASAAAKFSLDFLLTPAAEGEYASFSRPETERIEYDTLGGGPEYPEVSGQTFPVGMIRANGNVLGIISDSPGRWENRCRIVIDPQAGHLAVNTGNGSPERELVIKYDARDKYRYLMDGWQSLAAGQSRTFSSWIFYSPAESHFQSQLAAHLALANAQGWNGSATEAILRNTSYLLLRRNLMRDEGRYIFISGIGYGWKQWVSDGFYTALGLDNPETTIESCRSVFGNRITYAENPHYYLIWSTLLKRAGGEPNLSLVREAYDFIRRHERDGLYVPPSLPGAPSAKGWKTYMDILEYEADDTPAGDQGFHCGALLSAAELGLPVTEIDFERSINGYRNIFNRELGYMPTSLKQQDRLGQDTLYGATLTYAVFGRKLLADEQVLAHHRYSLKTASPYGLRVISQADGSLLPGHSGAYVFGGSWFLCDAANYLLAGVHGLPQEEVDRLLAGRIRLEIAHVPAFNESISTVTGEPHGHILYSWNSGYWWLRSRIRERLGQTGPDPVDQAIDAHLHVVRDRDYLTIKNPTPE